MARYIGQVRKQYDGDKIIYRSRPVLTWEEAHHRAEKHCPKGDNQLHIVVVYEDTGKEA